MISNPNLVSQIAKLPHLSDEQLKNYINDKSNPLSPFALATLQSKAIARKKFGTPEVPKQTVADQVEAEADAPLPSQQGLAGLQPQGAPMAPPPPQQVASLPQAPQGMAGGGMVAFDEGGVASLPLRDDMYNEDSFAHGGIVGFANRGSVDGSIYSRMYGQEPDQFGNIIVNGELVNIRDLPMSNLGTIGQPAKASKSKTLTSIPTLSDVLGSTPHGTATETKQTQLRDPANWGIPPSAAPVNQPLVDWQRSPTGAVPETKAPAATADKTKPIPDGGVANLLRPQDTGYEISKPEYTKYTLPSDINSADYIEKLKGARTAAGVDAGFYDKQAAKNEIEREALKGERTDAGWSAALRAGLGMMGGKSQNPWANISEGATAGLAQYGTDIKDIKSDEKLLRAADDKLAEAQYLQSRGDADGAFKAMNDRQDLITQVQMKNVDVGNLSETARSKAENDKRALQYTEAQTNKRHAETIAVQKRANEIAKENKDIVKDQKTAALYASIEAKAKADVDSQIKNVSEYQGGVTQAQMDKLVRDTVLRYQRDAGLPPLSGPAGWSYEGQASTSKNK